MKILTPLLCIPLLAGCARFGTVQKDISYDSTTGNKIREITTKATGSTFFDAKSELAKWKASQTDKTQSAEVGGLSNLSSGTNAVQALKELNTLMLRLNGIPAP